jgi:hypothetical protein
VHLVLLYNGHCVEEGAGFLQHTENLLLGEAASASSSPASAAVASSSSAAGKSSGSRGEDSARHNAQKLTAVYSFMIVR